MRWFVFVHGFASCECVCVCQLQRFTVLSTVFSYWQGVFQQLFPFNNVTVVFSCQRLKWKWKQRKQTYDDMKLKETWNLKKKLKKQSTFFWCEKKFYINFSNFQKHTWTSKTKKSKKAKRTMGILPFFIFTMKLTKSAFDNLIYTNGVSFCLFLVFCLFVFPHFHFLCSFLSESFAKSSVRNTLKC